MNYRDKRLVEAVQWKEGSVTSDHPLHQLVVKNNGMVGFGKVKPGDWIVRYLSDPNGATEVLPAEQFAERYEAAE